MNLLYISLVISVWGIWEFKQLPEEDTELYFCQYTDKPCDIPPSYPFPRESHSAVLYTTWDQQDVNNLCPGNYCGPYCENEDASCFVDDRLPKAADDNTLGGRKLPNPSGEKRPAGTIYQDYCPDICCLTENCKRGRDMLGEEVPIDREYMIIFGGLALRNVTVDGKQLYNHCNDIKKAEALEQGYSLDFVAGCGSELMNELWRYDILSDTWTYLKPSTNRLIYSSYQAPYPRHSHSAVYTELITQDILTKITMKRKYMYIYGGFAYQCGDACGDMWRYEIPWAAQRYYPEPKTGYWNRGNVWEKIVTSTSPGNRMKHGMVASRDNKYIYLLGGIYGEKYYNDLWRFTVYENVWERIDTLGITNIMRTIQLWNGEIVEYEVNYEDRKISDQVTYGSDGAKPKPRASFSMQYIATDRGNYIIVFGGWGSSKSNSSIGTALNDMWVYSIATNRWTQVIEQNLKPDNRRDLTMAVLYK